MISVKGNHRRTSEQGKAACGVTGNTCNTPSVTEVALQNLRYPKVVWLHDLFYYIFTQGGTYEKNHHCD